MYNNINIIFIVYYERIQMSMCHRLYELGIKVENNIINHRFTNISRIIA